MAPSSISTPNTSSTMPQMRLMLMPSDDGVVGRQR